jgi:hypothetical protein
MACQVSTRFDTEAQGNDARLVAGVLHAHGADECENFHRKAQLLIFVYLKANFLEHWI